MAETRSTQRGLVAQRMAALRRSLGWNLLGGMALLWGGLWIWVAAERCEGGCLARRPFAAFLIWLVSLPLVPASAWCFRSARRWDQRARGSIPDNLAASTFVVFAMGMLALAAYVLFEFTGLPRSGRFELVCCFRGDGIAALSRVATLTRGSSVRMVLHVKTPRALTDRRAR